jgi:hypothetical protein
MGPFRISRPDLPASLCWVVVMKASMWARMSGLMSDIELRNDGHGGSSSLAMWVKCQCSEDNDACAHVQLSTSGTTPHGALRA